MTRWYALRSLSTLVVIGLTWLRRGRAASFRRRPGSLHASSYDADLRRDVA